jgi:type VI secretion system secreted protein VgrG
MADDPKLEGVHIKFVSGAMPDDPLVLRGVWGRERIGRLFEFDLLLSREVGPLSDDELDELLKAPCAIALGKKPGDVVHGLLERIELIDSARTVAARYLARLVPNVWLLTLSKTCRVYQDTSVPDLIRTVLKLYGMKDGEHFDVRVSRAAKSPVREYIVQYQESDWDFLQRWMEHEGFFYWFEHGEKTEKLIIADENADASAVEDPSSISYRERNNLSTGGASTIWDWNLVQRRIPARVALVDYNYRQPSTPLFASEKVDEQRGFGTVFAYGEHFKDKDVGKAMAKLRAERFQAQRRTYSGRTDCARFRVGHSFELENHHDGAHDGKYLLTALEHRVGFPVYSDGGDGSQRYSARFEAIPFDVAYRPERRTPWPRIHGVIHAMVEGDTSGDYAEIDDQGRYKVRMPFDMAGKKGGKASRWIRMAQPYAGPGYGSHHPLHKGVEVLVAHVDGDPDRPVILSAVPNPRTTSTVTSANATQSVTQTASGIRIEMEDRQS